MNASHFIAYIYSFSLSIYRMNSHLKKELLWLLGIIVAATTLTITVFGTEDFFSSTLDINIHDTYYVIESINAFLCVCALLIFVVYLPRLLLGKFKSRFANMAFLLANAYLIFLFTFFITIAAAFNTTYYPEGGHTLYPPTDTMAGEATGQGIALRSILMVIQLVLIVIFGYIAYKSGLKGKTKPGP